jgi:ABC-type multidrug transport system ATPase subunit
VPGLTFREFLAFSVRIKNARLSSSEQTKRLNYLISVFDLESCLHTIIPEEPPSRGIAGFEFRKLQIAAEIADLPLVMLVDEPTLTFDPMLSYSIFQCLKKLCNAGHILICSMITAFPQEVSLVSTVVVLSDGYSILSTSPDNIVPYYCQDEMGYEIKEGIELLDFVNDIATGVERSAKHRAAFLPSVMQEIFERSQYFVGPTRNVRRSVYSLPQGAFLSAFFPEFFKYYGYLRIGNTTNRVKRAAVIIERAIVSKVKDVEIIKKAIGASIICALLVGYLQWNQGDYGSYTMSLLGLPYLNTANISSLLFFSCALNSAFAVLEIGPLCLKVEYFRYEQRNGVALTPIFLLSALISDMPFTLLYSYIFATIVYFMSTMHYGYGNYNYFVSVLMMLAIIGKMTTIFLAAAIGKEWRVRNLFLIFIVFEVFLSGFPFHLSNLDSFLSTMAQINPIRYLRLDLVYFLKM